MNMCIAGIASRFRIKSGAVTAATAAAEVINTSAKLSLSSLNTFFLLAAGRERERERERRAGLASFVLSMAAANYAEESLHYANQSGPNIT